MKEETQEKIVPTAEEHEQTNTAFVEERMRFVQSYPFYGILLLELNAFATGPEVPVAAVNYRQLFLHAVDPDRCPDEKDSKGNDIPKGCPFWSMTSQGRKTVLAHEILHLVFEHLSIPSDFNHDVANIAMDSVINRILEKDGAFNLGALPPGIVTPIRDHSGLSGFTVGTGPGMKTFKIPDYANKDWIPIYWEMMKQLEEEAGRQGRKNIAEAVSEMAKALGKSNPMQGDTKGDPNNPNGQGADTDGNGSADFEQQKARFRQKVVAAVEAAKAQGTVPAEVDRMVGELQEGKVHWTTYLRRLIKTEITRDDFTNRSNSRRSHLGSLFDGKKRPAVYPKVESESLGHVFLAIDTSGSMSKKDVIEGLSEFASLRQTCQFPLHFVSCDAQAYDVKFYDKHEEPDWLSMPIKGGGGTDFRPVFEMIKGKVKELGIRPALLVYFTDTMGSFPEEEPSYPVIWVCNYKSGNVPWGTYISTVD